MLLLLVQAAPFIGDLAAANGYFDCGSLPTGNITITMAGHNFTFGPKVYVPDKLMVEDGPIKVGSVGGISA